MKKLIKVVGAVIENNNNEILCALRSPKMSLPNMWEFPGGKVEKDENLKQAIEREIREELGCTVEASDVFNDNTHEYDTFIVNLITCKKHIFDLKDSKNILFVRFDNKLGDTVVDTFFIKGLRAQAANAKITLLIRTPYNELLEGNEDINEIITLPNTKYIYAALKMILKLKKNKYDVIIDIPYTLSIKRILFYSILKPKAMVAVNNSNYKFVTHTLQIGDVFQYQQHISELYSLTINMFGNQNYNKGYFLFSRKDIKRSVELFLNDNNIKNEKILFFNTEGSTAERSLSNKKITELLFLINYNFKNLKIILSVFKKNIKIPQNTDIFLYKADSLLGLVEMIKT